MSDIANAIYRHLRTMAPHQLERLTAIQLREAADEIERLRAELSGARQRGETGQPVLSDEEREAVELAAEDCRYHPDPGGRAAFIEATLRGLLERLGVLPDREHPPRKGEAAPARSGESGDDSPDRE